MDSYYIYLHSWTPIPDGIFEIRDPNITSDTYHKILEVRNCHKNAKVAYMLMFLPGEQVRSRKNVLKHAKLPSTTKC